MKDIAGYSDSRPEVAKPKAGKTDRMVSAKKGLYQKGAQEAFASKRGSGIGSWVGQDDSRPNSGR